MIDTNTFAGTIPSLWAAFASGLSILSLCASPLHDSLLSRYMHARVVLTSRTGTLVLTLGFCPLQGWLPNWSRPCTLMGFVVATKSALRPRATLASGLSRSLPRKRGALRPSGLSAMSGRHA